MISARKSRITVAPLPPKNGLRPALVVLIAATLVGCSSTGGVRGFTRTPADPSSRVYPSVTSGCVCPAALPPSGHFDRVLIVVFENQDFKKAMEEPYLKTLAAQGANFTNFHGLFHPSYSNYLAMVAGKEIRTHFDGQRDLNECSVADLLREKNLDWKSYAEDYPGQPGQCVTDHSIGLYARKHVPLMSFRPVQEKQCGNMVSDREFERDLMEGKLPRYAFYTPNLKNDGHDTDLGYAAKWLRGFLDRVRARPAVLKGTLIVVTFDESADESEGAGNHIYTVFLGDMVKAGRVDHNYNHFNVLRTIEDNFGLCALAGGDGGAKPITGVWKRGKGTE